MSRCKILRAVLTWLVTAEWMSAFAEGTFAAEIHDGRTVKTYWITLSSETGA